MRLLTLLVWTILVMLKRGIIQLIDVIEERVFERVVQPSTEGVQERRIEKSTLLPPLSDEIVLARIWPLLHQRVNISLLWRLQRVNWAWRECSDVVGMDRFRNRKGRHSWPYPILGRTSRATALFARAGGGRVEVGVDVVIGESFGFCCTVGVSPVEGCRFQRRR